MEVAMQYGTPCWIDLATTDPNASRDFYGGLFGWQYRANPSGDYFTALVDNVPAAGFYRVPEIENDSAWTLYLAVPDSRLAAERVVRLGGQVLMPPQEFDGQGSLMVAADPTGASIGFWQPSSDWPFATGIRGEFRWAELNTWDGDAADKFFVDLFGYQLEQIGDGNDFDYTTWSLPTEPEPVLGRMRFGADFPASAKPHWMIYFEIGDALGTDEATMLAVRLGGRMLSEPADSPFGRLSVVEDPSGAAFTLINTSHRPTPHAPDEDELGAATDDPYDD
jgi:predicted enzyme related to lactoylglutathione lyase